MKKLSFLVALFLGASSAFAAQDTVSMVTYFPMPYVSYNNLTVTKQLDVGLGTQCKWEMGNDSAATCPLTATTVNLWGTLRLRNFTRLTQTTGTTLGNTTSNTGAQLKFQSNLRIHEFENSPMTSVHAENVIVSGYDKLGVYSGRVNNPTYVMNQCTEGVHWEEITGKDDKSGVYLVCGQSTGNSGGGGCSASDISAAESQVASLKNTTCNECGTYANASYSCNQATGEVTVNQGECSVSVGDINTACYTWGLQNFTQADCRYSGGYQHSAGGGVKYWTCLGCNPFPYPGEGPDSNADCARINPYWDSYGGYFNLYGAMTNCNELINYMNTSTAKAQFGINGAVVDSGISCNPELENFVVYFNLLHGGCQAFKCVKHKK